MSLINKVYVKEVTFQTFYFFKYVSIAFILPRINSYISFTR